MSLSRRRFLEASANAAAAAAAGLTLPRSDLLGAGLESVERVGASGAVGRPCIIASTNGLRGVVRAYEAIGKGSDPLDAIIEGVNIQELDPNDQSVGLGGLPNEDGVVHLYASCMHGPTKRPGAVAALEDIATPSLV